MIIKKLNYKIDFSANLSDYEYLSYYNSLILFKN